MVIPIKRAALHVEYTQGTGDNQAPNVNAGTNQTVNLPSGCSSNVDVSLNGTVSDDGLPTASVTTTWSQESGPGTVSFADANAVDTTVSFDTEGTHVLRLTADDGDLSDFAEVTVTINPSGAATSFEVRVSASSDDAEESATSGIVNRGSSDLELVDEGSNQFVGIRFNGLSIPQGANITNAYIQFQVDEPFSGTTDLMIEGHATNNAPTFTSANANISNRNRTNAVVGWTPVPWTTVGEAGTDQQTPDIATVIQEIINRPQWLSGNSLAVILSGSGRRTAESFNGDPNGAALLHIDYTPGTGANQAPVVNAGTDQTVILPNGSVDVSLNATVNDDGQPAPVQVDTLWTQEDGPGTVSVYG